MSLNQRKYLEKRLRDIERERIQILAALEGLEKSVSLRSPDVNSWGTNLRQYPSNPHSLQGKVVNSTIALIKKEGREVSSAEILHDLREKKISLGKNEPMTLAAVLGQEITKRSARLVRVARGLYNLKNQGQSANG